jgi:hypothetical protein
MKYNDKNPCRAWCLSHNKHSINVGPSEPIRKKIKLRIGTEINMDLKHRKGICIF